MYTCGQPTIVVAGIWCRLGPFLIRTGITEPTAGGIAVSARAAGRGMGDREPNQD